eukprot:7383721-Prymnesium_polylepis.2
MGHWNKVNRNVVRVVGRMCPVGGSASGVAGVVRWCCWRQGTPRRMWRSKPRRPRRRLPFGSCALSAPCVNRPQQTVRAAAPRRADQA